MEWLMGSITTSAAFVRNGRLDVVAHNVLGRTLHAPMVDSPTTDQHGRPDFARYHFLDDGSRDFRSLWVAHEVRIRRAGVKRLRPPPGGGAHRPAELSGPLRSPQQLSARS
ncbi:MmyB family transcriptional regulator [Streptomyces solaniscabiei]|uniref:MmyB family transcriptional regulator n=1 Tax=Streptomyces solaniscabiei TaxID=2683255 RepID=UPI001CE361BE|nr:hypothetical protein [Streptomyces solaniscabiei]